MPAGSVNGRSRYDHNDANQLTSRAGTGYSYDLNGNTLTEAGGNTCPSNASP